MKGERDFRVAELELLGEGQRRQCFALPDSDLCAKFYHSAATLPANMKRKNRWAVNLARHWRYYNLNYREWHYYRSLLQQKMPPEIINVFPEHMELVKCSERGWGLVQTTIRSCDGTLARRTDTVLQELENVDICQAILKAVEELFHNFIQYNIRFFDHSNVLVQWSDENSFKLRIVDIEPVCRALIPGLVHIPWYVRGKLQRHSARNLKKLAGIINSKGR